MKIHKIKNSTVIHYRIYNTYNCHGIYNAKNLIIGYNYQDKEKGFWLIDIKR
jgi:hypothetical protein